MPQESAELAAWRAQYVPIMLEKRRLEDLQRSSALEQSQAEVLAFLSCSKLDLVIRAFLRERHQPFTATKIDRFTVPLDGQNTTKHPPAFLLDHQGLVGHSKRFEYPGLSYTFRLGYDEVVLTVTLCRNERSAIFPHFLLTHRDGRTHEIDWQVSANNIEDQKLREWLSQELDQILIPSNSPT